MKRIGYCTIALLYCFIHMSPVVAFVPHDPHAKQGAYALISVYDAWDIETGSDEVVVAVIDNGFDHYHPDLRDNVWQNKDEIPGNNIDDDNNGYIDDMVGWNFVPRDMDGDGEIGPEEQYGNNNPRPDTSALVPGDALVVSHGTAVAGILAASGYNGMHGSGIAWNVSLMNLKIVGNSGSGSLAYLAPAIRYAVDNGADIISMSVVGQVGDDSNIIEAIEYAYENDVVLVAAAGNRLTDLGEEPRYPVCADAYRSEEMILGVSAVAVDRRFARFSNFGGDCIDITAPGIGVSTTVRFSPSAGLDTYYRGGFQGTSFAVPMVSGAAALIRSAYPELSNTEVIEAILSSTSKTPTQDEALYQQLFGAGLLQIDDALTAAKRLYEASILAERVDVKPFSSYVHAKHPGDVATTNNLHMSVASSTVIIYRGEEQFLTWQTDAQIQYATFDPIGQRVYLVEDIGNTQRISRYTLFGATLQEVLVDRSIDGIAHIQDTEDSAIYTVTQDDGVVVQRIFADGRDVMTYRVASPGFVPTTANILSNGNIVVYGTLANQEIIGVYTSDGMLVEKYRIPTYLGGVVQVGEYQGLLYTIHSDVVVLWSTPSIIFQIVVLQ